MVDTDPNVKNKIGLKENSAMYQKYVLKGFHAIMSLFCFLMIAFVLVSCASQSTQPVVENPVAAFEQEVERLREKYKIPGMSVAILQKQQIIFADGFGYADIENKIPATANTPYNIG